MTEIDPPVRVCPEKGNKQLLHIREDKWQRTKWGWIDARKEIRRLESLLRVRDVENRALRSELQKIYQNEAARLSHLKQTIDIVAKRPRND